MSSWQGVFGDAYHSRQTVTYAANCEFFRLALRCAPKLESIIELGAGTGRNIEALHRLHPFAELWSVEINEVAASRIPYGQVLRQSLLDPLPISPEFRVDLVFTKGVLIHIQPDDLPTAYQRLYERSKRYILIAEYYNPTPVQIDYRDGVWLGKRDFAGELLNRYPDLRLIDYGFAYHRDTGQDDLTWFLLEKQ